MKLLNLYELQDSETHEFISLMYGPDDKAAVRDITSYNEEIIRKNKEFFKDDSKLAKIANSIIVKVGTYDVADSNRRVVPMHEVLTSPDFDRWKAFRERVFHDNCSETLKDSPDITKDNGVNINTGEVDGKEIA